MITPCEGEGEGEGERAGEERTCCWVPVQDACFGKRLVVPAHAAVNEVFPPQLGMGRAGVLARQWEYADGHWRAVLPSVDEQMRRGLHSRAVSHRRRSSRCRRAK